ncbi:bile acid:sodium symporter family protein [Algoriphagus boritolerans]|uniref:Solute carrier family 10 (Sodium/bile acid cotransporter), member 7 n=1 Tax=Algoriphagus boritolerans DSM 17298 = JCM 18970 TaxID=1120964 RepID=A0A1H5RTD8_9BACT|nr:bile acid:sodium symporter family protein [Algoriphagus boritolerans]SEF40761.1 solute carrier family 10 (sodium/bile acid cotransporter), member 7 [Algoriphagus boritolerans DSM 17298 = JCM 18970]
MIHRLIHTLQRVGINGFLLGLFFAIGMAAIFPEIGAADSGIPWTPLINFGIAFVFFFYGVKLDPRQLRSGLSNWRLHLLIQLSTFLIFPVIVFGLLRFMPWVDSDFKLGISYLSALPSTVSASVVMVSIAGGNLPAAIFNASISSLLGVILTPAWMGILGTGSEGEIDFWSTLGELTLKVILPVILGTLAHGWLFPKIKAILPKLKYVDQTVIMIIVFTSFAESFGQKLFTAYQLSTLVTIAATMLGIFILIWSILELVSRFLRFSIQDRITTLFCGSKKSLVHGVVIGKVIFPDAAVLGLVLLPVMLYHIQQLILGSVFAGYFGRRTSDLK